MTSPNPVEGEERELQILRDQCDQAKACAFLSGILALAIFISNFAVPNVGLIEALELKKTLAEAVANDLRGLEKEKAALHQTEASLASLKARP